MKAMVLAAGLGLRMLPLTRDTPKALLAVRGRPLIDWHLAALARAGFREVVINVHHLADRIMAHVGDGAEFGLDVTWSLEEAPLETAGAIVAARDKLGDGAFAVISCDVFTDFDYARLYGIETSHAHMVMVDNPPHHPEGDFSITADGLLGTRPPRLTYAGIGVFHSSLFDGLAPGKRKLREIMDASVLRGEFTGEFHSGFWSDVGTPERLRELNQ